MEEQSALMCWGLLRYQIYILVGVGVGFGCVLGYFIGRLRGWNKGWGEACNFYQKSLRIMGVLKEGQ